MDELNDHEPICPPLAPRIATDHIRAKARDSALTLTWTRHAKDQMEERGLEMGDVKYVLRNGFVYDPAQPSTQRGFYKYRMVSSSPNSNRRMVRVVVIPAPNPGLKVITVMWADETLTGG